MAYSDNAYDFSLFESSAAPAYVPQPRKKAGKKADIHEFPVKEVKKKNRVKIFTHKNNKNKAHVSKSVIAGTVASLRVGALAWCLSAVIVLFLGTLIGCRAYVFSQNYQINVLDSRIKEQRSEQIRLMAMIASMDTPEEIEDYAINVLGMVKAESHQIERLDFSGEDGVVISGGRSYTP